MARTYKANEITVFKFHSTGLAELCLEVADYVRSGEAHRDGALLDTARYTDVDGCYNITFVRE